MIRHVVHLAPGPPPESVPGWFTVLERHLFVPLRATSASQVRYYAENYPLAGVLIKLDGAEPAGPALIADAARSLPDPRIPVIGLAVSPPDAEEMREFAAAGLNGIHAEDWPPDLLVYPLRCRQAFAALADLEKTGMNVKRLAEESRKILHDMSQPMAALQGRIQVLEAGADDSDPMKKLYAVMAAQAIQASEQLRKLHELTRRHS